MWLINLATSLPSLLGGLFKSIDGITQAISNERIALIGATTDRERIEIGERIAALTSQRDVLVADSAKSNWDMYMRLLIAFGPMSYLETIFFWDKVMGKFAGCSGHTTPDQIGSLFGIEVQCKMFETDPVTPEQWYVVLVVLGFYFVHSTVGLFKSGK